MKTSIEPCVPPPLERVVYSIELNAEHKIMVSLSGPIDEDGLNALQGFIDRRRRAFEMTKAPSSDNGEAPR